MRLAKVLLVVLLVSGCASVPEVKPYAGVLEALENTVIVTDGMGHGSGMILQDGLVVTAKHCVGEGLVVGKLDGTEYEVTEYFVHPTYDVAILCVPGIQGDAAVPADLEMLLHVWILGAPLDVELAGSMTEGFLVNLDRDIWNRWEDAIQVSAWGAPGNSGGPVVDDDGRLVGIVVAGPNREGACAVIVEPVGHIMETIRLSGWF